MCRERHAEEDEYIVMYIHGDKNEWAPKYRNNKTEVRRYHTIHNETREYSDKKQKIKIGERGD